MASALILAAFIIIFYSIFSHAKQLDKNICQKFSFKRQTSKLIQWLVSSTLLAIGIQILIKISFWKFLLLSLGCLVFTLIFVNLVARMIWKFNQKPR